MSVTSGREGGTQERAGDPMGERVGDGPGGLVVGDPGLEAAPTPEPEVPRVALPVVCRMLRTKTAFGSVAAGSPDWRTGDSTTATYWCLQTMETAGMDDGYAHPHMCREGRGCFVMPDR